MNQKSQHLLQKFQFTSQMKKEATADQRPKSPFVAPYHKPADDGKDSNKTQRLINDLNSILDSNAS